MMIKNVKVHYGGSYTKNPMLFICIIYDYANTCIRVSIWPLGHLVIWRILLLHASNIYRRVLLVRLCQHLYVPNGCHHGPTQWSVNVFKKYGILQVLLSTIETGDILSLSLFKKSINELVTKYESTVFIATCMMYPKLSLFQQCTSSIVMWPWWQLVSIRPDLTSSAPLWA